MKIPLHYILGAVIFGIIVAAGIVAMTYHPPDIQVQLHQYSPIQTPLPYQPAPAPAPAVPTIVPTVISTGKFDPAPAPVIVTTAPVPTITSSPVATVGRCDPNNIDWNKSVDLNCATEEMLLPMISIMNMMPILTLVVMGFGILQFLIGFGRGGEY